MQIALYIDGNCDMHDWSSSKLTVKKEKLVHKLKCNKQL